MSDYGVSIKIKGNHHSRFFASDPFNGIAATTYSKNALKMSLEEAQDLVNVLSRLSKDINLSYEVIELEE